MDSGSILACLNHPAGNPDHLAGNLDLRIPVLPVGSLDLPVGNLDLLAGPTLVAGLVNPIAVLADLVVPNQAVVLADPVVPNLAVVLANPIVALVGPVDLVAPIVLADLVVLD